VVPPECQQVGVVGRVDRPSFASGARAGPITVAIGFAGMPIHLVARKVAGRSDGGAPP
jgi:hypothetical protein